MVRPIKTGGGGNGRELLLKEKEIRNSNKREKRRDKEQGSKSLVKDVQKC